MGQRACACKIVSIAIAAFLALCLVPAPAFAVTTELAENRSPANGLRNDEEIESAVAAMLVAGDYVEGEAVVCYVGGPADSSGGLVAQSSGKAHDLLSDAEPLSQVSAHQYAEATGDSVPTADERGKLSAQSASEPVKIALVHRDDMTTEQLLRALLCDPRVLSAEPNYVMSFADDGQAHPESTGGSSWHNMAAGESSALAAAQDDAASADLTGYQWFSEGAPNITPQLADATNPGVRAPGWNDPNEENATGVVVIMDSGVDYTHPDLANVMFEFSPELQAQLGCGKYGYAPGRADKTDPMDGYGHGTHCAGIVAAEWNGFGVSGVANGAKICAVSISSSTEDKEYSYDTVIKGYDFIIRAAEAGVDIRAVNRSFGVSPTNNANQAMIQAAGEAGIVTCIASGNVNRDMDKENDDIATSQQSPYVLRVNASKLQDDRAWFSCYGRYTTDVFAPGVAILSTYPSNQESLSRYFPQADDDPLYLETSFEGTLPDIEGEPDLTVESVSKGETGVDGDGKSLEAGAEIRYSSYGGVFVDVPVDGIDMGEVQDISVAFYIPGVEARFVDMGILLDDDEYATSEIDESLVNTSSSGPCSWNYASLHVTDPSSLAHLQYVTDSHGRTCMRLRIEALFNDADGSSKAGNATVYLDQIAIGKRGNSGFLPYAYLNGTSMATPCVAGCAAIVSSQIAAANPAERAAQTVRLLKGSVHQSDGYRGLCKQNGQVDLSLLGDESAYAPVLESARVSGNDLVVDGAFFGEEGTLLVGGKTAQVKSWSTETIEASWPEGVTSGLVPLTVTTAAGSQAYRAFALAAPEPTPGGASLYERDLVPHALPGEQASIMDAPQAMTATEDGALFAAVPDGDGRGWTAVRYLMRSDDHAASWTACELPRELKNVSLAAGDGKVFVLGSTPADEAVRIDEWHLYSYDVDGETFEHLGSYAKADGVISARGSLAYANGCLYLIDVYEDPDDQNSPSHMRMRRFEDGYGSLGDAYLLDQEYKRSSIFGPHVAATGNTLYVCGIGSQSGQAELVGTLHGLERIDVAADGGISYTNLSAALSPLTDGTDSSDICLAANDAGVFLVGRNLEALLPDGAAHTDTFFLGVGETSFAPYGKTLSFAPVMTPAAVCADGWLYAYAASKYEATPQFGRATKYREDPGPKPDDDGKKDDVKPDDGDKGSDSASTKPSSQPSSSAKTGDAIPVATIVVIAIIAAACLVLGRFDGRRRTPPGGRRIGAP